MQEISLDKIQGWKNVSKPPGYIYPDRLDVDCPYCARSIIGMQWQWHYGIIYLSTHKQCIGCRKQITLFLTNPPKSNKDDEGMKRAKLFMYPTAPLPLSEVITELEDDFPRFVKIYRQALQAERSGLDELVGMGFRKSLEFLVKDFVHKTNEDKRDKIKDPRTLLSTAIGYLQDKRIQERANMASWLGNDETHYLRRNPKADLEDLKALLEMVIAHIYTEMVFDRTKSKMGE